MQPLTVDGTADTEYLLVDPWLLPTASNPARMQGAVDHLLEALAYQTEPTRRAHLRSQIGFMLICLSRADEAVQMLQECASTQQSLQYDRGLVATELRLTQALQATSQVSEALGVGQVALSRCVAYPALCDLQHFAHQHLGKVNMQAGLYDQARHHLQTALDFRLALSADELVASTQAALSLLRRHAAKNDA